MKHLYSKMHEAFFTYTKNKFGKNYKDLAKSSQLNELINKYGFTIDEERTPNMKEDFEKFLRRNCSNLLDSSTVQAQTTSHIQQTLGN